MIARGRWVAVIAWVVLGGGGCGGHEAEVRQRAQQNERSRALAGSDRSRCDATAPNREASEYDTSGDHVPDVRKVFLRAGEAPLTRLVLICREADLNGDGTKDVVRYYNDEGRPLREEADRNFDGQMDEVNFFERGRVVRQEVDSNRDGRVDTKVFYAEGLPQRSERDTRARSTQTQWRPDTWEYFEEGRMVRMGVDLDGDGRVDRWDRDETLARSESILPGVEDDDVVSEEPDAGVTDAGRAARDAGRRR